MEKRKLGRTGLEVSVLGLGCNNFGGMIPTLTLEDARRVVHAALDASVTLFDTSDSYGKDGGSETTLGEVLGAQRKDIVLATKFASPMNRAVSSRYNGSRAYIMGAVEASLRRLRTDYIDLYQYHFPDPQTPIDETLRALDDLVRQGKVRYIGCSNLPAWMLVDADWSARDGRLHRFASTQTEYNLLARDAEHDLFPAMQHLGMGLLPYFPLASGLLTGKYRDGQKPPTETRLSLPYFQNRLTPDTLAHVETLIAFAQERGRSILELAFAFLLAEPLTASVIAGATKTEQIAANAGAVSWRLSGEDRAALTALLAAR